MEYGTTVRLGYYDQIGVELASAWRYFLGHTAFTTGTTLLGFTIAVVGGVAGAIGIVYSKVLNLLLSSLLVSLNSVPKVALAPLFVIWMGTGVEPKVAIVVMIAVSMMSPVRPSSTSDSATRFTV